MGMEQATTRAVGHGTLRVRSLRELRDARGDRLSVATAVQCWTRSLLPAATTDAVLVFLIHEDRVRAVHEVSVSRDGKELVRDTFRAAIVFGATRIVLAHYLTRDVRALAADSDAVRLLRNAGAVVGIAVLDPVIVDVRATDDHAAAAGPTIDRVARRS
jgi:DNA repair protein RadC